MHKERTLQTILTRKQFQVAILVASGIKNSEIAMILGTTEHVVKNIMRDVYERSGCSNRVELALLRVHEKELGMYDEDAFHTEVAALRTLIVTVEEELVVDLPFMARENSAVL
jgi:DNA-binding CsgD family transcriptional regulator